MSGCQNLHAATHTAAHACSKHNTHHRVIDIHGVYALWQRLSVDWCGGSAVPEPQCFVPASSNEHIHGGYKVAVSDGCIMLGNLKQEGERESLVGVAYGQLS
eukprot:1155746-Pelagomonas_calceolata.AAC.2